MNLVEDVLEHLVQLLGIGGREVELAVRSALAHVVGSVASCIGIVARHGVHIAVCVAFQTFGIRTAENTDRINRSSAIFQVFCALNGAVRHVSVKAVPMVRLAIGEEDDHFLGILARTVEAILPIAVQQTLRMLHAVVGTRSTRRIKIAHGILQRVHIGGEVAHNLGIIVSLPIFIIADFIRAITAELNKRNT